MKSYLILASAVGLSVIASSSAGALDTNISVASSQYAINITGFVPVICRATVDSSLVSPLPGTVRLGQLKEFCNSANGYRVHAEFSPALAGATLLVDGAPVPLDADGSVIVSQSGRAAVANHDLALDLPDGVQGGNISFRMEPL